MAEHNPNIIYIYDGEHRDIISIDAETGERIDRTKNNIDKLLAWLDEQSRTSVLRKFTIWCALQTNDTIKPVQHKCLSLAENAVQQDVDQQTLQQFYDKLEGPAVSVDSVGLRQGSSEACGFLITRECVNPDAYNGAKDAARYYRLCKEMGGQSDLSRKQIEQIQINSLLDLMNE